MTLWKYAIMIIVQRAKSTIFCSISHNLREIERERMCSRWDVIVVVCCYPNTGHASNAAIRNCDAKSTVHFRKTIQNTDLVDTCCMCLCFAVWFARIYWLLDVYVLDIHHLARNKRTCDSNSLPPCLSLHAYTHTCSLPIEIWRMRRACVCVCVCDIHALGQWVLVCMAHFHFCWMCAVWLWRIFVIVMHGRHTLKWP